MHILLSNDDGYLAQGLIALANGLQSFAEISVVAPDKNRSAASNSLTLEMHYVRSKQTMVLLKWMERRQTACIWL